MSETDPGFPRGGVPILKSESSYDLAKFCQKLHENEEN